MEGSRPMADVGSLGVTADQIAQLKDALARSHHGRLPAGVPCELRGVAERLRQRLAALQASDPRFQQVALSSHMAAVLGSPCALGQGHGTVG